MTRLGKAPLFFVLLIAAALAAGLFGALHNQLSFSVGPSYFTEFKFPQFGLAPDSGRFGAAQVGWQASWWMGLIVGLPVFGVGAVLITDPRRYLAGGIAAIFMVLFVAFVFALGGLVVGMVAPGLGVSLPILPEQVDGFARAALMHNGAYLGGIAGGLVGVLTMWKAARLEQLQTRAGQ